MKNKKRLKIEKRKLQIKNEIKKTKNEHLNGKQKMTKN